MGQSLTVQGDGREYIFDGHELASYDSRVDLQTGQFRRKPRWLEFHLFRADDGEYVLQTVGRSLMLHLAGCPVPKEKLPRFQERFPGEDPSDGNFWFCDDYQDPLESIEPGNVNLTELLAETDWYTVTVSPEPKQIVKALYRRKEGARILPWSAQELLDDAADEDEGIRAAYAAARI